MHDIQVLFVDDERNVLNALERNLIREPYRRRFVGSGLEALESMAQDPAQVVVSDMRMPGMDGLSLLRQIKELYPETIRMILSGHTEVAQILASINSGEVFRYITKPLEEAVAFQMTILQAIELYQIRAERRQLMESLERRNLELEATLGQIKRLEGMLPICASCKKIRDDKGYWQQIEIYISERTQAVFSHGLCPSCVKTLYPDLFQEEEAGADRCGHVSPGPTPDAR
ncbi:MAG: response regulator [bacterium]